MSNQDNPFAAQTPYQANVTFGGADQPRAEARGHAAAELIKDTTTAKFSADVVQESRQQPVLVDFWAPWCGPCKQLTPVLEKVVRDAAGAVKLVKMNIDEHPAIAGQLGIQSIPAVIAFKNGQPVDGFMGALPETQVREFVRKLAGDGGKAAGIAEAIVEAQAAAQAGDAQTAAQIYDAVLSEAPDSLEAIAGLADLLFEAGDAAAAEELLTTVPEDKASSPILVAIRAKMSLAAEAAAIGDPSDLQRRLAADPKDHQARFDLAMIQNVRGEREAAADNLLAIVKADRGWNDDGARTQLLKFFEAWGLTDPATLSARRKLSSLLFA